MSSVSNPDAPRERTSPSPAWQSPLLITGCPRTGTSALARLLSTHDRICIFNEFSLYHPPALEDSVFDRICQMTSDNPPPAKIDRDIESLQSRLLAELPKTASDGETTNWLFGRLQKPVAVYGDKMPFRYLGNMEEIAARFPSARFLVTLRDGRAVIASQIRQHRSAAERGVEPNDWMQPTVKQAEFLWLRSARKWLALRAKPPAPCLEVRYEDATNSPEALAQKICAFAGLDYRRAEFQEFLDAYEPIHVDAWREEMPEMESQLSDEFRDVLSQLGYA